MRMVLFPVLLKGLVDLMITRSVSEELQSAPRLRVGLPSTKATSRYVSGCDVTFGHV